MKHNERNVGNLGDIENFFDAYVIAAPIIRLRRQYRRSLARVLMTIYMMRENHEIGAREKRFLVKMIRGKFNCDEATGKALCRELCAESEYAPTMEELTSYIKAHSTIVERADCVREMWEVAFGGRDGQILDDEIGYRCAFLLGLDAEEAIWLKELSIAGQGVRA